MTPRSGRSGVVDAQAAGARRDVDGPPAELGLRRCRRRRPPGRRRPRCTCRASRGTTPRRRRPDGAARRRPRRGRWRRRRPRTRPPRRCARSPGPTRPAANASGSDVDRDALDVGGQEAEQRLVERRRPAPTAAPRDRRDRHRSGGGRGPADADAARRRARVAGRARRGGRRPARRRRRSRPAGSRAMPAAAPHASSRRMTGNRSSGAATTNPSASQNAGCGGARRVLAGADLRVGLDRREPAAREVVAHRLDEVGGQAATARLGRRRDAGDHGRQRRRRGVAGRAPGCGWRAGRPRVGRTARRRPRLVVVEEHLRVDAEDGEPAPEQPQLGRRVARRRRGAALGAGANGLNDRLLVVVGERVEGRALRRRGERVEGRLGLVARERVGRPRWRRRCRRGRRGARARTNARPSSRGRRSPSSRTTGGRTRDPRTAARARTRRRR